MLLIGLLPTLIVSVVAYLTISNALVQKTANQLVSAATEQEQKVDGILQTRQEQTIDLTTEYNIQNALQQYVGSNGAAGGEALTNLLVSHKVVNPSIQAIYVVDLKGKTIATTVTGDEGKQFNASDYTIPEGQQTALSIREDSWDSVDKLYITSALNVDKKPTAYLRVIFYTDDIVAILQDYTGLGATGETVVAEQDSNGNAVSLFPLRFDTAAALKTKLNTLQLFSSFGGSYKDLTDYRGHPVMVAAMPIGYADWVIATKIDSEEALAPIVQMRSILIIIAGVSSVLIFVLALYAASFFTRPIFKIIEVAKRIGRGDFMTRIGMRRQDEIGTLADNIDHMGASLKDFVTSIETQRNRLGIVLNSTTESILAVNKKGIIITANKATAELTQLDITDIEGKNIGDIFAWTRDGGSLAIDYNRPETKIYEDLQYINHAGSTRYIKLIVARVDGDQSENSPQIIVTIHDETKSRELEAMKVDFVSMAAHELRTPLAAIRGYLELIMFKAGQNTVAPDTEKYLKQALGSTNELSGLINNLLDVTRIERGTLAFSPEKVDLAASAKQSVQDLRFSADDKQIKLAYDGPSKGYFVIADQIAIHEVMNNLISNAIKYTNNKGTILVSLAQEKKSYVFKVKDSGIGIAKTAQPNIFTKFYRAQAGLNSGNTGTGLGLFISKSIVERHNGTINFVSEEGKGSTFSFKLPILDEKHFASLQTGSKKITDVKRRQRGWLTKNTTR